MKKVKFATVTAEIASPPPAPLSGTPVRLRLPLATVADVRREMARLYREGKSGQRDVGEVSRLGNLLALLGRVIEASALEDRISNLEQLSLDK